MEDALLVEFPQCLAECRELYQVAGEQCVKSYPDLVKQSETDFLKLLDDLHRGILIKAFVTMVKADWRWSSEERELAQAFVRHLWDKYLQGTELKKAFKHLLDQEELLNWGSLLRPFCKFPPLQERAGELETIIVRMANIVAKADGEVHEKEVTQLRGIQHELESRLYKKKDKHEADDEPDEHSVATKSSPAGQDPGGLLIPLEAVDEDDTSAKSSKKSGKHENKAEKEKPSREEQLKQAMAELDGMIGLSGIKQEIRELVNFLKIQEERARMDLPKTEVSLHMVFTGNPGTGKTTVARIVGKVLGGLGILTKGHSVETDRSGLVAQYAGQTGPKTNKRIDDALDGVLFIDEAYSLVAERGEDPYGGEAVQAVLKRMEDERHRLVVVIAGYPEPMDRLLLSNPGLSSRFGRRLSFPDYSASELGRIFASMCEKNHYVLPLFTRVKLLLGFQRLLDDRDEHFGNGRLARNIFEGAIRRLANRIASIAPITRELLTTLEPEDIHFPEIRGDEWEQFDHPARGFVIDCAHCSATQRIEQRQLTHEVTCARCSESFVVEWADPALEG